MGDFVLGDLGLLVLVTGLLVLEVGLLVLVTGDLVLLGLTGLFVDETLGLLVDGALGLLVLPEREYPSAATAGMARATRRALKNFIFDCDVSVRAGEKKLVNVEVPLPDDTRIVSPAEYVPKEIAAFSGA